MSESPRTWEGVLHNLEARLLSGELGPGNHLPPERALAAELGVGRSSVREAIRVLEALGLVRTQTGSGPQAGAIIIATPAGGMSALLRLQVAAKGFDVADVVKTRVVLETAVASDLARGSADLSDATTLLNAMDSDALSPTEFLALDARFHVALAEASGNHVVTAMMAGLRNSIESYVVRGVTSIADWPTEVRQLRSEHRGILEAISHRDTAAVAALIHDHITGYYTLTKLTEQDSP